MKRLFAVLMVLGLLRGCSYAPPVGGMVDIGGSVPEKVYPEDKAEYFTETSVFDFTLSGYDYEHNGGKVHMRITLPFGVKYYASGNSLYPENNDNQKDKFFYADANWSPYGIYEETPEVRDQVTELIQNCSRVDSVFRETTIDGRSFTLYLSKMYEKNELRDVCIQAFYPLNKGSIGNVMFIYNIVNCRELDETDVENYISDAMNSLKSLVYEKVA